MISFSCHVCGSLLTMDDQHAGQPARCPTCKSVVTVPARTSPPVAGEIGRPAPGYREAVRRFGFNCPWCSSRLEATLATAGQSGQCPTCSNTIRIPILDRYGRLIDPDSKQIIKPDPHPVHAYAAAGDRAPIICRAGDGHQTIQCSRCKQLSPITANACKSCGIPFTLEGTVQLETSASNGYATTSLVLGILGLPTCMLCVPSILAIVFGIIALSQLRGTTSPAPRTTAIAGLSCGVLGLVIAALTFLR